MIENLVRQDGGTHILTAEARKQMNSNLIDFLLFKLQLTLKVLVATIDVFGYFKHDDYSTVGGYGGCRVGEVRAGTTSPMPDHKGFKLQYLSEIHPPQF